MALFVKGFRVLQRMRKQSGQETFKKIGRVFHVRSSAQALCDMMNTDARARGPAVEFEEYFVSEVVGRDPKVTA